MLHGDEEEEDEDDDDDNDDMINDQHVDHAEEGFIVMCLYVYMLVYALPHAVSYAFMCSTDPGRVCGERRSS